MCTQWVWIWILVTHALQFIIYLASKFVFETISTWYFRDISLWERRCCRDVSLTITNPILQINLLALLKYLPECFGDEIKIIIHLILSWAWKSQHAPIYVLDLDMNPVLCVYMVYCNPMWAIRQNSTRIGNWCLARAINKI